MRASEDFPDSKTEAKRACGDVARTISLRLEDEILLKRFCGNYNSREIVESFMKFAEIAILLREIVDRCPSLDGSTITLIPQKAMYPLFQGYHINIKANITQESMGCLRKIVEGHDLMMKTKADSLLIYESRPQ